VGSGGGRGPLRLGCDALFRRHREPVPDETTVCRFRHQLEEYDLGRRLFEEVHRASRGEGVEGFHGHHRRWTIITAPSSTKNAAKARDPDIHQTKKGNQWYFGV